MTDLPVGLSFVGTFPKKTNSVRRTTLLGEIMKNQDHSKEYSEESLWEKLAGFAKTAGREVVEKVLTLFEALKDKDTPGWAKGVIIAALGYFISPVDAIPDVVPFAGFADDLGALAVAISTVAVHIKDEHVKRAQEILRRWFESRSAN